MQTRSYITQQNTNTHDNWAKTILLLAILGY